MLYTRRDIGKMGLAAGLVSAFGSKVMAATKPNSRINGVQIGTITYSYRSMPDQSAEATLKYIVDSGISAIELMGGPVNDWARKMGKWEPVHRRSRTLNKMSRMRPPVQTTGEAVSVHLDLAGQYRIPTVTSNNRVVTFFVGA